MNEVGIYLKLINQVMKQDLKDRHGVSLLGVKTEQTKQEAINEKREMFDKGY